jgi:hypothetical protein
MEDWPLTTTLGLSADGLGADAIALMLVLANAFAGSGMVVLLHVLCFRSLKWIFWLFRDISRMFVGSLSLGRRGCLG